MSDGDIDKVEDVVWDDIFASCDHVVSYHGGESLNGSVVLGNSLNKPSHEVENNAGKSTDREGSVSENFQRNEATLHCLPLKDGSSTVPDVNLPNDCFESCNTNIECNTFCSEILQTKAAVDHDVCHFSPPVDANIEFLGNEHRNTENEFWNFDWPDSSNFGDIDILFRQGSWGTGEEISWFSSSSHAIYGSQDTFRSTVQSSVSDLGALNSTVGRHVTSTDVLTDNNLSTVVDHKPASLDNLSYASVSESGNKGKSPFQEQAHGGSAELKSSRNQTTTENNLNECMIAMNVKELEKGKSKDQPSECMSSNFFLGSGQMQQFADQELLSSVVSTQICSSQLFPQQHCWRSDSSSYMSTFNPQVQLEHSLLPDQVPLIQTTSIIKSKTESNPSSSYKVPIHDTSCISHIMERFPGPFPFLKPLSMTPEYPNEQAASASITSAQNEQHSFQYEMGNGSELKDVLSKLPKNTIGSSIVQENSCMTYGYSDDVLLKASGFHHLQNIVDQLDVASKMCIRDSLYRLAKSAVQRNIFSNGNSGRGKGRILRRSHGGEYAKRCAEVMVLETDSNPIDRSVAQLLLHRPSELTTGSAGSGLRGSLMIK